MVSALVLAEVQGQDSVRTDSGRELAEPGRILIPAIDLVFALGSVAAEAAFGVARGCTQWQQVVLVSLYTWSSCSV